MDSHPLQFFKDLVENKHNIIQLKNSFFRQTLIPEVGESIAIEVNREEEYFIIDNALFDIDYPNSKTYFKDYLALICQKEKLSFLNSLDTHILNEKEPKASNEYLLKILFEVNYLIAASKNKEYLEKYPIILETIQSIKTHLHSKYGLPDNSIPLSNKKVNTPKIQWLGKTNVLTTLFYDLLNGQDKGEAYIHANKKDIMQFLIENFLDKNGDELSESTIQSYFDKQEKKAKIGDRIELPNKKVIR